MFWEVLGDYNNIYKLVFIVLVMRECQTKTKENYQSEEIYSSKRRDVLFVPKLSKIELSLESFTAMRYHGE